MTHGYARISTNGQDLAAQLDQLKAAGCERVFHAKLSGLNADRPQLKNLLVKNLLATVEIGDTIIIQPSTGFSAMPPAFWR